MERPEDFEQPPWSPNGVPALAPPLPRPVEGHAGDEQDHRFRPHRPRIPGQLETQAERTHKAIADQCSNSRIPGYTGYIPSQRAETVYARTSADTGRVALREQNRRQQMRASDAPFYRTKSEAPPGHVRSRLGSGLAESKAALGITDTLGCAADFHSTHALGKSRAEIARGHWVPTIPGYGGHIPGKYAENLVGGGVAATCQMAGRAIAERSMQPGMATPIAMEDGMQRSRMNEFYGPPRPHGDKVGFDPDGDRVADQVRAHCERSGRIPGYSGHIPRVRGESLFGGTQKAVSRIAADYVEDRIYCPENHINTCCVTQAPLPRKLRV